MASAAVPSVPFTLSRELEEIRELAFDLARRYGSPSLSDRHATDRLWRELAAAGLAGISISREHGGGGLGMLELCLAMEGTAAAGFPAGRFVISTAIAGTVLSRRGSDEQRRRWLPGVADGTSNFCFALTEAGAGSNAPRMATRARREGGRWRIRGEKTYISGVDTSQAMLVAAQTPEFGGISLFIVDLPRPELKMQPVPVQVPLADTQFTLHFDDLEVADDAVVGDPGKGLRALFDGLNPERLVVAAQAVGLGRWSVERAVGRALQREVFSGPIGAYQAVQHPLAEALVQLEASWLLTLSAAARFDSGEPAGLASNMAKVAATDAGYFAADRALQAFGGSGFTAEAGMFERFATLRLLRSIPVARELALNHIAQEGLGLPKSY